MPREPISVRIDKDIHQKVKSAASLRGTNLEGAYDEALRNWLEHKANIPGQLLAKDVEDMTYYSESVKGALNHVAHFGELFSKSVAELETALADARGKRAIAEIQSLPDIENATGGSAIERAAERVIRAREANESGRGAAQDSSDGVEPDRAADRTKKSDHRKPSRGAA